MSFLNPDFARRGTLRLVLILVAALALTLPAHAQKAKEGLTDLDALVFTSPQFRMSETFADSDAIKDRIGFSDAIAAFKSANGEAWRFTIDERIGRVNLLDGGAIPFIPGAANALKGSDFDAPCGNAACVPPATVEKLARNFLTTYQKIFLVDPNELELDPQGSHPVWDSIYTLRFQWKPQGVPVEGGSVYFIINNGNLIQVGMQKIGNMTLNATPKLSPEAARLQVDGFVNGLDSDDTIVNGGTLTILPITPQGMDAEAFNGAIGTQIDYVLAYTVAFQRPGRIGTWEAVVDAGTGAILRFRDSNAYGHVQGGVYKTDKITGFVETTMPFPFVDYGTGAFCDMSGNFTGTTGTSTMNGRTGSTGNVGGVYITDSCGSISQSADGLGVIDFGNGSTVGTDCTVPTGMSAGDTHAARTQYWNVTQIKMKAYSYLPGNTWLQGHLQDIVNLSGTCNAYWDGTKLNFFKVQGTCGNTGEIPGVSLHEWGHGLDNNDGSGSSTDNAPVEARADWTAISQTHLSCAGAGFLSSNCGGYGDACTSCKGVREADWAMHSHATAWTPQNKGTIGWSCSSGSYNGPCGWEDHCESGIAAQAHWDFVNRDLVGSPTSMDAVSAWQLNDRLFYGSMSTSVNMYSCSGSGTKTSNGCGSGSIYTTFRAIDDDGDGTANGTPHAAAIFAALNRHGIACGASTDATNLNYTSCAALAMPGLGGSAYDSQDALGWSAVPNATRYFIFRNETDCASGFTRIATVAAPATTYTDTLCYNGVTYNYRIEAATANDSCVSPMSACMPLTPTYGLPGPPTITSITDVSACAASGIQVNFTPGTGANHYNLYKDGVWIVTAYTSGATYTPGDTATHTYMVQSCNQTGTTNSTPMTGTDVNNSPGAPVITSITDNNACAQDGIHINFTGSGAQSYNVIKDGSTAATGYTSGALFNPGDTSNHTYMIQAANGACTANSTAYSATDSSAAPPGAPVITGITDVSACAQSGIKVTYTPGSGATSHDLYKDGVAALLSYTSGATYSPGDTAAHTYVVRAKNSTCHTDSAAMQGTDANNSISAPAAPAVQDADACAQSGMTVTWGAVSGATGYDLRLDGSASTIVTGVTSPYLYTPGDGNSHTYQVRARNASACNSPWSTATAGTDASGGPATPAAPSFSSVACTTLTVGWAAVSGATGYDVYRRSGSSCAGAVKITSTPVTGTSFNDSGLAPGAAVSYYVVADSSSCSSSAGTCNTTTTLAACAPPAEDAPGTSSSNAQSWNAGKTTQSWPSVSGATSYTLYRGTRTQLPSLLTSATDSCTVYSGAATSASDASSPAAGQVYWYLVTAGNSYGEGPAGNATAGARIVNSSGMCP